jgi:hypothetical protein
MKHFLTALLLSCVMLSPVAAADVPASCTKIERVKSDVAALGPDFLLSTIEGTELKAFMAAYNAEPPVSEDVADVVAVVRNSGLPMVTLVFFVKGCVSKMVNVRPEMFEKFMGAVI